MPKLIQRNGEAVTLNAVTAVAPENTNASKATNVCVPPVLPGKTLTRNTPSPNSVESPQARGVDSAATWPTSR